MAEPTSICPQKDTIKITISSIRQHLINNEYQFDELETIDRVVASFTSREYTRDFLTAKPMVIVFLRKR